MADSQMSVMLEESLAANSKLIEMLQATGQQAELIKLLEDANAEIRKSIMATQQVAQAESKTIRFLDLPRELRDEIYRLLLVRGKVFLHTKSHHDFRYHKYEQYGKPEWQMLAVSRQVREEAAEILFRENHIDFPGNTAGTPVEGIHGRHTLNQLLRQNLTTISISFDCRARNNYEDIETVLDRDYEWRPGNDCVRRKCSPSNCHDALKSVAIETYTDLVWEFGRFNRLEHLKIDLSYCYCASSCCRMNVAVAQAIAVCYGQTGTKAPTIEVTGSKSKAEREQFVSEMLDGYRRQYWHNTDNCPNLRFKVFPKQALTSDERWQYRHYWYDEDRRLTDGEVDCKARRKIKAALT